MDVCVILKDFSLFFFALSPIRNLLSHVTLSLFHTCAAGFLNTWNPAGYKYKNSFTFSVTAAFIQTCISPSWIMMTFWTNPVAFSKVLVQESAQGANRCVNLMCISWSRACIHGVFGGTEEACWNTSHPCVSRVWEENINNSPQDPRLLVPLKSTEAQPFNDSTLRKCTQQRHTRQGIPPQDQKVAHCRRPFCLCSHPGLRCQRS